MRRPDDASLIIREEQNADVRAIRAVHDLAFERDAEGRLVDRLRNDALIVSSVLAELENEIVGSAVFSKLPIRTSDKSLLTVALAPVAVKPAHQQNGIGSRMIEYGLRLCVERGYLAAFVVGDPRYYSRFGFSHDTARAVRSPYSGAGPAWMALLLGQSTTFGLQAQAEYPAAFEIVD